MCMKLPAENLNTNSYPHTSEAFILIEQMFVGSQYFLLSSVASLVFRETCLFPIW